MSESSGRAAPSQRPLVALRPAVVVAAVAVLSVLPYVPALGGEWLFDDQLLIERNRYVHSLRHVLWWLSHDVWDLDNFVTQSGNRLAYFRPVLLASYALDWVASGGNPVWFHFTNLIWHALGSVLVYSAFRRWIGPDSGSRSMWPPLIAALIFAWHPTKAESVAWITGRTDVMVTVGLLLVSLGVARRLRRTTRGVWLEALGVAVAFGSKEQAVVMPILVAVEVWVFLGRPALELGLVSPRTPEGRRLLATVAPYAGFAALYLLARAALLPIRTFDVSGLSLSKHVALVFESFGRYLSLTLWPGDLSISRALIESGKDGLVVNTRYVLFGAAGVAGLLGSAWALRMRTPALSVAAIFYLVNLLPVVNVIWTGLDTLVSPRFLYLPLLGIAFGIGEVLGSWTAANARLGYLAVSVTSVAALALAGRGAWRSTQFASEDAFWRYELENKPWAPYALAYKVRRLHEAGQDQAALAACQKGHAMALRHVPHTSEAATFVWETMKLLATVTPDRQSRTLEALSAFARSLLESSSGAARLSVPGAALEVPLKSKAARALRADPAELLALVGRLELRLGNDPRALDYAQRSVAACHRCPEVTGAAVRVALGSERFDLAERWLRRLEPQLPGPAAHQARDRVRRVEHLSKLRRQAEGNLRLSLEAQRLALLELWGRAWRLLQPHRLAIISSGLESTVTLAELAFRSGDEAAARRLLQTHLGSAQIDRQMGRWRAGNRQVSPP